jgi:hypothetical protein
MSQPGPSFLGFQSAATYKITPRRGGKGLLLSVGPPQLLENLASFLF